MTPRRPVLFSAKYQYMTLQGSIIVRTSPRENGRSLPCSPAKYDIKSYHNTNYNHAYPGQLFKGEESLGNTQFFMVHLK